MPTHYSTSTASSSADGPTNSPTPNPTGSDFVIKQVDFDSSFADRLAVEYQGSVPEDRIQSWPMVYVLSNSDEAYVGQTTSVSRRMTQHGANPEKQAFTTASVIYNEEFNASVITDYEHRLIDLMQGDMRFRLTNRNGGQAPTNYFSRETYAKMFSELWDELRDIDLVGQSIDEIEQSEAFKFSPFKVLNADQEVALQDILKAIDEQLRGLGAGETRAIVVEGMPGTGKTVLAISLLKTLKDLAADNDANHKHFHGINVRLLEPVTGLRQTVQRALKKTVNLSKADVIGPMDLKKPEYGHKKNAKGFDVLLIDEAHKLGLRKNLPPLQYKNYDAVTNELGLPHGAPQLDWVLDQARVAVFFYDPLQSTGPKCIGDELMRNRLGSAMEQPIELKSQMRVKGGDDYLEYIRRILFGQMVEPKTFANYEFVLHTDFVEFKNCFDNTLSEHSLTRMVAGYAWEWKTKTDRSPEAFDIEIDGVRLRWNRTFRDWVGKGTNNESIAKEVGCIHSIQGYDLSHAFVIIGNDLRYDPDRGSLYIDRASYFDPSGKKSASNAELDRYIRNIYYVLLTRGVESTHVYVCNDALREQLKQLITTK